MKKVIPFLLAIMLVVMSFTFMVSADNSNLNIFPSDQKLSLYKSTNLEVGYWFNTSAKLESAYVAVSFNSTSNIQGVEFGAHVSKDIPIKAKVELYKFDTSIDTSLTFKPLTSKSISLQVDHVNEGDQWGVKFDDVYPAGKYVVVIRADDSYANADEAKDKYFVLATTTDKADSEDVQYKVVGTTPNGETKAPVVKIALTDAAAITLPTPVPNETPVAEHPSTTFDGKKFYIYEAEDNITTVDVENGPSGCPANVAWPFGDAYADPLPTASNGHVVMRFWGAGTMYPFTAENGAAHAAFAGKPYLKACSIDLKVTVAEAGTYEVRVHGSAAEAIAGKFVVNGVDKNFTYTAFGKASSVGDKYKDCQFGLIATVNLELKAGENTVSLVSLAAPGHAETIQPDVIYVAAVKGATVNTPTGDLSVLQYAAVAILTASSVIIKRKSK